MLISTLVPLALVLALGALAVGVVRARHRRNVGEPPDVPCLPPPTRWGGGVLPWSLLFHRLKKMFWESQVGKDKPIGTQNLH